MQTSDKRSGQEPETPREKGGGDGSAKAATEDPAKTKAEESPSAGDETQGGLKSREITTPRG